MKPKPRLLLYGITWNEQRNILFSHYLSEFFEVYILTINKIESTVLELTQPATLFFEKFKFPNRVGLAYSLDYRDYLKTIKPEYVLTIEAHSFSSYHSVILSERYGYKSIVFEWENVQTIPRNAFQKSIQKKVLQKSNCFIAGSIDAKKYLIEKGGNADNIFINPETGFDKRIFFKDGDSFRKEWGFGSDDFVILFAGRIVNEKGIELILKAAGFFEKKYKDIKFVFAGNGNMLDRIKDYRASNVFVKNRYSFTEMGNVIRACDLLIYPSLTTKYWVEQFGFSVVEAQACGKPVVVSNSGTLPRLVQGGITGSVVEEGNQVLLEEKILWWYKRLKENKKVDISNVDRFSAENIALNYKKIIIDSDKLFLKGWY